jgi:hypothetical protein
MTATSRNPYCEFGYRFCQGEAHSVRGLCVAPHPPPRSPIWLCSFPCVPTPLLYSHCFLFSRTTGNCSTVPRPLSEFLNPESRKCTFCCDKKRRSRQRLGKRSTRVKL